jgi:hypothetical protein
MGEEMTAYSMRQAHLQIAVHNPPHLQIAVHNPPRVAEGDACEQLPHPPACRVLARDQRRVLARLLLVMLLRQHLLLQLVVLHLPLVPLLLPCLLQLLLLLLRCTGRVRRHSVMVGPNAVKQLASRSDLKDEEERALRILRRGGWRQQ